MVVGMLIGLLSPSAFGVDYYVSTSGSDSAPGSLAQPFATIQHAVRRRAMNDGLSTKYRLERALFAGPSPDGDDINQYVDVAAHAQELTGAVRNALARIAKQRQAQLRSLAAPLLPGGDAAAAQLARGRLVRRRQLRARALRDLLGQRSLLRVRPPEVGELPRAVAPEFL